jgi:hypothetical protein
MAHCVIDERNNQSWLPSTKNLTRQHSEENELGVVRTLNRDRQGCGAKHQQKLRNDPKGEEQTHGRSFGPKRVRYSDFSMQARLDTHL